MAPSIRSAPLLVLGAAALWGTTGAAEVVGGVDDPIMVGAARLAVGGVALVAIALVGCGSASLAACLRRPLIGWTVLAAIATAVYQSAFFSAVASTGVATGTVVALGIAPVATGLCAQVLFGERLTRWWLGSTALAVVGCVVLVGAGHWATAGARPRGVALAVVAGSCYGLYTCAAKALLDRQVPAVVAMGVSLGAGAVLLTPVLVAGGLQLVGVRPVLMVGWLGLVTTAAAYLLFADGLRRLPPSTIGTLSLAEPLTAAALGLVVLGERTAPESVLGGVILLAGLVLSALRPGPAPIPPPPSRPELEEAPA